MIRPRHKIRCEKCSAMLDRAINVKRAVCRACRTQYATIYFERVRKQAAGYRELMLLLGVKDEGRFFADLRQRAASKGRDYMPGTAPCPTCGVVIGLWGFHRLACARRSPEDRAYFREHGRWPDPRKEKHEPDDGVRIWLGGTKEKNERIRQVARDNPELGIQDLIERFGGSEDSISKLLSRANIRTRRKHEPSQAEGNR